MGHKNFLPETIDVLERIIDEKQALSGNKAVSVRWSSDYYRENPGNYFLIASSVSWSLR